MGRRSVPYSVALGVERILLEFSDAEHPLTITDVKNHLKEIYGIEISDDVLRKRVIPEIRDFCRQTPNVNDGTPGLNSGWELGVDSIGTNTKVHLWAEERLFANYEVDFLADTVTSLAFLGERNSEKLLERIQSLQSRSARADRRLSREDGAADAKPDIYTISHTLDTISEAIERHRTISFDYRRYGVERRPGTLNEGQVTLDCRPRNNGERFNELSPYRLQFMDGHYFLLANAKGKTADKDRFRTFRVDLIDGNVEISEDDRMYIPLANEDAPADYFRGAVNGFGGRRKTIELRCSAKAFHYVAERFLEFEDFKVWIEEDDPDGWCRAQFKAMPQGVELWVQRFLEDIELVKPKSSRERILKKMTNNAYRA